MTVFRNQMPQYAVHNIYGCLMLTLGSYQFIYPASVARMLSLNTAPFPAPSAVLCQTVGLIIIVLGTYSVVACLGKWNLAYFQVTAWPMLITGAVLLYHSMNAHIPEECMYMAALQIFMGFLTIILLTNAEKAILQRRWDRVTFAQMMHTIISGCFTTSALIRPALILPLLIDQPVNVAENSSELVWATLMGTMEILMTWTYAASALYYPLQCFAYLSVYTRLGAVLLIAAGYLYGVSSSTQLLGVLPDGLLACITVWALRTVPPSNPNKNK